MLLPVIAVAFFAAPCDVLIQNGDVLDGTGAPVLSADIVIVDDRIAVVVASGGELDCDKTIDASGLVVAPGFINVLSWAVDSLVADPRAISDIYQGVTLEVFGEGVSMGPVNALMKAEMLKRQGDIQYDIEWSTLGGYLEFLEKRGISPNVASFVGATTVRVHELGFEDRAPDAAELARMQELVREAMREGALGVGASLIYAPAFYADTDELVALAAAAGEFDGSYITHMRSEGNQLLEAVEETIEIGQRAGVPAEIYHLKAAGEDNWAKLSDVFDRVETARAAGIEISANMYTYTAGATGLDAAMPPWVQEGGYDAWAERLGDPEIRERVMHEMKTPTDEWENLYLAAGSAERLLLVGFKNAELKHLTGKSLAEVAAIRGLSPEETAMDLVIEDGSRVGTVYFLMSEDNVRAKIRRPWVTFGSDAGAPAPEGVFLKSSPHPRAYGTFARLLGRYVRDEGVISLPHAIHRLTLLPATRFKLRDRGRLAPGYFADIAIFDPDTIIDRATFAEPHQLAEGMHHVLVNGTVVLQDGHHTGATPGRFVRGPGAQTARQ